MVHYYISQVKHANSRPNYCVNCGKTNLKDDAVLTTMGDSEATGDYVQSVLCLDCETLMIVTNNPLGVIGIHHSVGNQVTVRNS